MRSNPLSPREKGIGTRLRIWRETFGYSRSQMVRGMGVSQQRLAHIEEGNAPLRWDLARMILSGFALNPGWLATGEGSTTGPSLRDFMGFDPPVSPRTLFSEVFDRYLPVEWETQHPKNKPHTEAATPYFGISNSRGMALNWLPTKTQEWLEKVPDIMISDFVQELARRAEELIELYRDRKEIIQKSYPNNVAILHGGFNPADESRLRETVHGAGNHLPQNTVSRSFAPRNEHPSTTEMQNNDIAQRITAARRAAKLSQIAAAKKWEISLGTLRDWEQGRSQPRGLYRTRIEEILTALKA